jgi:hypothetical protein
MRPAPHDPDLEPLAPEGWDGPPPRLAGPSGAAGSMPPKRQPLRFTPKLIGFVAGVLVAASAFALYASVAVSGVRALEHDFGVAKLLDDDRVSMANRIAANVVNEDDIAISTEANRALMREHQARALALAHHAAKVRAVDPGVRKLRDAVVGALLRDEHDLSHYADAPQPQTSVELGRGYAYADRLLERSRKQWHLGDGRPASARPPRAGELALAHLRQWSDEQLGTRFLALGFDGLHLFDVDQHTDSFLSNVLGFDSVVGRGFVAGVDNDRLAFIDLPTGTAHSAPLGFDGGRVVVSASGDTVWVQEPFGGPVTERDPSGTAVGAPVAARGTLLSDVGGMLLWNPDTLPPEGVPTDFPVTNLLLTDRATGRVVRRMAFEAFLASSRRGLAWRDVAGLLHVSDLAGHELDVPQVPESIPTEAAFSPDGQRLAVLWQPSGPSRLQMIDLGTGLATGPVAAEAADGSLRWSPDGELIFFRNSVRFGYLRPYESRVHMLRLRQRGELLAVLSPQPS